MERHEMHDRNRLDGRTDIDGPRRRAFSAGMSRRRFLVNSAGVGFSFTAAGSILAACGGDDSSSGASSAEGEPINVLTWETYHPDELVKPYADSSGIPINITEAGSVDEMYAQARSGGDWDVLYFDTGSIQRYRDSDLIVPFDESQVENVGNITDSIPWREGSTIDDELWGVPYNWGTQPLMYDADVITEEPTSWGALWDPQYEGQVVMFDDSYITIPMVALYIGAADPYNLTDEEFEEVSNALSDLRPQVRTIAKGFDDAVTIYASGDGVIGYCQNVAVVAALNEQGRNFAYTFPEEKTPMWIDEAIVTERGNRPEVYEFINENLSIPWQGEFINTSANNGIVTPEGAKEAGVKPEILKNSDILTQAEPGFTEKMSVLQPPESVDKRLEVWNEFKAGA